MAQTANGSQPTDAVMTDPGQIALDQHIPGSFHAEVIAGPQGGRFLAVTLPNRREVLLLNFSDDAGAEKVAKELKPSRLVTPGDFAKGGPVQL